MNSRYEWVVFDFDGTLADTMRDHFGAWEKASLDYGIKLNPEDYYPLEGTNVFEIAKRLFKVNQIIGDEKDLVQKKEKYYLEPIANAPELRQIINIGMKTIHYKWFYLYNNIL